ncbi:MAG: sigma 54-interacting transcriptional regulator [Planctomyces sp.]
MHPPLVPSGRGKESLQKYSTAATFPKRSTLVTLETALICSGSPGFLRNLGSALTGQCRLMECYSVAEVPRLAMAQDAKYVVIDSRGATPQQLARTFALITQCYSPRVVLATTPGQLSPVSVPLEVMDRVEVVELQGDEDYRELATRVLETDVAAAVAPIGAITASTQVESVSVPLPVNPVRPAAVRPVPPPAAMPMVPPMPTANAIAVERPTVRADFAPSSSLNEPSQFADQFRTRTPELRQMLRRLEVAARHSVTILLIGETGSGKTHLANLIHSMSPRSTEPFLHVACGALPGELIESELFGHVKGAFTSAHADKDGKFLAAGNGTILLDEIDVLTPDQQVKLLRVIEQGEFEPVGSNRTLRVKARIIAASNLQLQPLVEQGRFRPDLYYRLNTLSFIIPPLRKRLPDIEPLARYFVHFHAGQLGIDVMDVADDFVEALLQYPWPGNVRELENAIRSAVIYSHSGRMTVDCLPTHILSGKAGPGNDPSVSGFFSVRRGESLENRMELTEKEMIEQALLRNNFSRTNTARNLGISRVTLYNKMRKYGMLRKNE